MTATSASSRGSSSRWAGDWMAPSRVSGSPNICCSPAMSPGCRHVDLAELALEAARCRSRTRRGSRRSMRSRAARTWGTPSTAWVAISWRHTHRRRSSAGRLHSLAELVEVGGDDGELVVGGPGDRQVVLAERALGQVADHRAGGHAEHRGPDHLHERAPSRPSGSAALGGSSGTAGLVLVQRAGQLLEQRPVGLERLLGPLGAGDRDDGDAPTGDRGRQAGGVGDLQVGDPGELLDLDALERVDVGLAGRRRRWRWRAPAGGRRPS